MQSTGGEKRGEDKEENGGGGKGERGGEKEERGRGKEENKEEMSILWACTHITPLIQEKGS